MPSPEGVNAANPPAAGADTPLPRLVLVSLASADAAALVEAVARRLGPLAALPLRPIDPPQHPAVALAELTASAGPWLAFLPLDVGVMLEQGSWAEALGAWRQPTLLVLETRQLASGVPAAATALLRQWQVPLVGLLHWDAGEDRSPGAPGLERAAAAGLERAAAGGLPWLGSLANDADAECHHQLLLLLKAAWREQIARLA